jgi:hypothetical protein
VFLIGNAVSSLVFYLMGSTILIFGHLSFLPSLAIQLVFYGLSEMAPLVFFVHVTNKFVGIISPPAPNARVEPEQQEPMLIPPVQVDNQE